MSPEDTEDLSPLPRGKPSRRGGISAEPVTEEDATSYVKKVITLQEKKPIIHFAVNWNRRE